MRAIASLLVIAAGLALVATPAEAAPKVAVVDLVQAIQEHPRTKVIEEKLRKAQSDAQAADERSAQRIKAQKEELDKLEEGNPARSTKEKQLLNLQNARKFNAEWAQLDAMRTYVRSLEQIYAAVRSVVGQVARDNGHDVVLLKTDPNQKLNSSSPEDFALKSRLRVVVYAQPDADITQEVIKRIAANK
ncbi:MAG: OmpH family outer membrane protein [Planctomycetota bacterium]|nr:OmpH family outer membrane protein [Planctomycetota bacterium]